jgi:hypothetical protein
MTIGKPGTGDARTLSVHFRIVSVAVLIMRLNMAMPQAFGQPRFIGH